MRKIGLTVAIVGSALLFGFTVHAHYPIQEWLFWSYARCWLLAVFWSAACACGGHFLLKRVFRVVLPLNEDLLFSLALGLLLFFLGMFVGGLLHMYGPAFFYGLPLSMLALGAGTSWSTYRSRLRELADGRWFSRFSTFATLSVLAYGMVCLLLIYFSILTPENAAYDSRWYHLAIAEHYASLGGIERFPEGWYPGALPHLASLVYGWAFLEPTSTLFDRVELCAHLEFVVFVWTLLGVQLLARSALSGNGSPVMWVSVFLFPGIYLYDSCLSLAADHVSAFWAAPNLLGLRRIWTAPNSRTMSLIAAMMAGALLTKYQAIALCAFPITAMVGRCAFLLARSLVNRRHDGRSIATGCVVAVVVGLALTAPHWLKNWIWYGDPLYPLLHKYLRLRPWSADAANLCENFFEQQLWRPKGSIPEKLLETLKAQFTFSFQPHDWPNFHGGVPVFGSMFTLCLPFLPFLKRSTRIWGVVMATQVGILIWYWVSHQDRYLQTLLPWMAAATASIAFLVWRVGVVPRVALSALLAFQIIWGGDVYFFPTHAMIGSPAKAVIDLLSSGYRRDFAARSRTFGEFGDVGKLLPAASKVLVHESHVHAGIGAMSVSDWGAWQGGISYGRIESPGEFYQKFEGYGVTHLLWKRSSSRGVDSLAGDLVFFDFAHEYAENIQPVGSFALAQMPPLPPAARRWLDENTLVAICPGTYIPGVYRLGALTVPMVGERVYPRPSLAFSDVPYNDVLLASSSFAVVESGCHPEVRPAVLGFTHVAARAAVDLWIRRR
jgi:hypothetical protein